MTEESSIRTNKYIALHGGYSRRQADELIEKGFVAINGEVARLGSRVRPGDLITINGQNLKPLDKPTYIAFHKPTGYVCSRRAQGDTPTIYDLLPDEYHALKTVGRLDKDSSGIILLTNDGDFTHQMIHPSFSKRKLYEVELDQPLQPLHRQMISDFGIMLEDGKSQFEVERKQEGSDTAWLLTLREGRNRQIRRTFSALGYNLVSLHRTEFGNYSLARLPVGKWREVSFS